MIGLSYSYIAILAASIVLAVAMVVLWLTLDSLTLFSIFVLIGYLAALQSGYLLGAYLGTKDDA
ncbi:hypothetical protein [Bosea psychrotolerans]|uniref:hypothetical protein n=1 Tax=Bosea psychrotolerans TaxID=1871628 RepID=UPI0011B0448A|nr:hypothetical protein [Bosea psychrotolerans]